MVESFKAAQIYELLAQQSEAIDSIQGLIEHFKTHSNMGLEIWCH
jgi:hypothetical protein